MVQQNQVPDKFDAVVFRALISLPTFSSSSGHYASRSSPLLPSPTTLAGAFVASRNKKTRIEKVRDVYSKVPLPIAAFAGVSPETVVVKTSKIARSFLNLKNSNKGKEDSFSSVHQFGYAPITHIRKFYAYYVFDKSAANYLNEIWNTIVTIEHVGTSEDLPIIQKIEVGFARKEKVESTGLTVSTLLPLVMDLFVEDGEKKIFPFPVEVYQTEVAKSFREYESKISNYTRVPYVLPLKKAQKICLFKHTGQYEVYVQEKIPAGGLEVYRVVFNEGGAADVVDIPAVRTVKYY